MNLRTVLTICAALLPLTAVAGPVPLRNLEEAVESDALVLDLDTVSRAEVTMRPCDDCAEVTLTITADTQLKLNGKPAPLASLDDGHAREAVLFYEPGSGRVLRITARD